MTNFYWLRCFSIYLTGSHMQHNVNFTFCKFPTFVAKTLIYGGRKRLYLDYKSQHHCLYIIASASINMPGRCSHKLNRASRISARLFYQDMVSGWAPKTASSSNWHWDRLLIKETRKSEQDFLWYGWIKSDLWGYESSNWNTCSPDFAHFITKIVAKYAYRQNSER